MLQLGVRGGIVDLVQIGVAEIVLDFVKLLEGLEKSH
jgi:hypothetical protein